MISTDAQHSRHYDDKLDRAKPILAAAPAVTGLIGFTDDMSLSLLALVPVPPVYHHQKVVVRFCDSRSDTIWRPKSDGTRPGPAEAIRSTCPAGKGCAPVDEVGQNEEGARVFEGVPV